MNKASANIEVRVHGYGDVNHDDVITDGDNDNITDMSIEFSLKRHNQNWNTFRLVLKDLYFLDESKLERIQKKVNYKINLKLKVN